MSYNYDIEINNVLSSKKGVNTLLQAQRAIMSLPSGSYTLEVLMRQFYTPSSWEQIACIEYLAKQYELGLTKIATGEAKQYDLYRKG